ncbi:MAG: hypothetical protein KGK16_14625, partial [Bradyrhizobium sp.]|nr:hypothetical protein [Bradyrhizobium sp.]
AIDPAISTLPVMNQLIALETDRTWVSAPRNRITKYASPIGSSAREVYHVAIAQAARPVMRRTRKSLGRPLDLCATACIFLKEIKQTL